MTTSKRDLSEKINVLSGQDLWYTKQSEALGLPSLKLSDGPNGVRGDLLTDVRSACFPVGVALGATWDPGILSRIGTALAQEAKDKSVDVVLGPTINLQRTPIGGRNFECFSEDPFLTGTLGTAFVKALQAEGVGACPKHFIANDQEYNRHEVMIEVDPDTLEYVYLAPFRMVVEDASPWMIMAAYNGVNGVFCCSHEELVQRKLKEEWGFDGVVVSDWGAALETVGNAKGGLDLEMPGPGRSFGPPLVSAVEAGEVSIAVIDDKIERLHRLAERTAALRTAGPRRSEQGIDRAEHRAVARKAAAASMVLLKNEDGLLPLTGAPKTIAVLGPNAEAAQIMGGGSSFVNSHPASQPLQALRERFASSQVIHHRGCTNNRYVKRIETDRLADGQPFRVTKHGPDGAIETSEIPFSRLMLIDPSFGAAETYVIEGSVNLPAGENRFGLFSAGRARLFVNEQIVVDNWDGWERGDSFFSFGSTEKRGTILREHAGKVSVRVEYERAADALLAGVQFGVEQPERDEEIAEAAALARASDITLLVLGSDADWESEGHDRKAIALPGRQNQLAEAVLAADPNTIIVMNVGSATEMPWYDRAKAVLVCWFGGEEMGNALADVLSGASDPAGRLPFTWPRQLSDHPAMEGYGEKDKQLSYLEGYSVGHRGFQQKGIAPLAAFGTGTSYGTVRVENYDLSVSADEAVAEIPAENSSSVSATALFTLWIRHKDVRVLCGFEKAEFSPGERRTVTIRVPRKTVARLTGLEKLPGPESVLLSVDGRELH